MIGQVFHKPYGIRATWAPCPPFRVKECEVTYQYSDVETRDKVADGLRLDEAVIRVQTFETP
jgi:hypothetical protein